MLLCVQLYPTLCNPMDYSLPGSSVPWISQARILEWVAMPSSLQGGFQPRDRTCVSCIAGGLFTNWATREACSILYIFIYNINLINNIPYSNYRHRFVYTCLFNTCYIFKICVCVCVCVCVYKHLFHVLPTILWGRHCVPVELSWEEVVHWQ